MSSECEALVRTFFAVKEKQARQLAQKEAESAAEGERRVIAPEVWPFFDAGKQGDWKKTTRLYERMAPRSYQFAASAGAVDERLNSMVWQTVNEAFSFRAQCSVADPKHLLAYGREIIGSVPRGSVYLCSSDPGRFVVTGLCEGQPADQSFLIVSPNHLTSGLHLLYLEMAYGTRLQLLTATDSQTAFKDYLEDVQRRARENKLKPDEQLWFTNGLPQVRGPRAVFEIIARLTRTLFEKNPDREFFVDFVNDGYPIEWMYPHLVPHGPTLRINRQPLPELGRETVEHDRQYWTRRVASFLGDWMTDNVSVQEICVFTERVYVRKDLSGFKGDKRFVSTGRGWHREATHLGASVAWGHARAAIASVYGWRVRNARTDEEQRRMIAETDLAFRQSLAMCPYSRETVYSFVNFLLATSRLAEARQVAKVAMKLNPEECRYLDEQLKALTQQPAR